MARKVNPAHYFFNDLTPEEYEAMIAASEVENPKSRLRGAFLHCRAIGIGSIALSCCLSCR